jgi:RNA polymerase sigma-70 factor (ECF subfamily)
MDEGTPVVLDDDGSGFDAFYEATARPLLGQLYAMCGDMGEAQDCLQEAYLRAWQRWSRVSTYENPAGWVRQVAWRLAVTRWHRARNAVRAWGRHGPSPAVAEPSPDGPALVEALRTLPVAQREAIVLHHLAGMSVDDIAAQGRVPVGTVKARLARGRARLALILSEEVTG